mmetsp:Transcript_23470/g.70161  ORF Transcript_23470/g.70161 Transcript_23470/m.70161 type:complete len:240 (+) Transcript_23470:22-741(+)
MKLIATAPGREKQALKSSMVVVMPTLNISRPRSPVKYEDLTHVKVGGAFTAAMAAMASHTAKRLQKVVAAFCRPVSSTTAGVAASASSARRPPAFPRRARWRMPIARPTSAPKPGKAHQPPPPAGASASGVSIARRPSGTASAGAKRGLRGALPANSTLPARSVGLPARGRTGAEKAPPMPERLAVAMSPTAARATKAHGRSWPAPRRARSCDCIWPAIPSFSHTRKHPGASCAACWLP